MALVNAFYGAVSEPVTRQFTGRAVLVGEGSARKQLFEARRGRPASPHGLAEVVPARYLAGFLIEPRQPPNWSWYIILLYEGQLCVRRLSLPTPSPKCKQKRGASSRPVALQPLFLLVSYRLTLKYTSAEMVRTKSIPYTRLRVATSNITAAASTAPLTTYW